MRSLGDGQGLLVSTGLSHTAGNRADYGPTSFLFWCGEKLGQTSCNPNSFPYQCCPALHCIFNTIGYRSDHILWKMNAEMYIPNGSNSLFPLQVHNYQWVIQSRSPHTRFCVLMSFWIHSHYLLYLLLISDRKRAGTQADVWILRLGGLCLHVQRLQKILLCSLCKKASHHLGCDSAFLRKIKISSNGLFWKGTMWAVQSGWAFSIQRRTSKWVTGVGSLRAVPASRPRSRYSLTSPCAVFLEFCIVPLVFLLFTPSQATQPCGDQCG